MDVLLIIILTLLNGAFAMSEMAITASRRTRLIALSEAGDPGARKAIELMDSPTHFLSTVQIGITSIGMLNGIVGEAAFSDGLAQWIGTWGIAAKAATVSATVVVVVTITFTTIIFGELVPKRIGQLYPEIVARWVSRPMALLAIVAKPFVRLLSGCTSGVLKLLRVDANVASAVTEDEIQASLKEGVEAGVIEASEHQMVRNVFHLDDRDLSSLMVPRDLITAVDETESILECSVRLASSGHTWFPVVRGGLDDIAGIVSVHQLLTCADKATLIVDIAHPASFVPETLSGMELLEQFRVGSARMVFVVDEYGIVQGMLTARDMLEAITGELRPRVVAEAWARQQTDGAWLVDGGMPLSEFRARLGIESSSRDVTGRSATLAGLVSALVGRIPAVGEEVLLGQWTLTVVETSRHRVSKILARQARTTDDGRKLS